MSKPIIIKASAHTAPVAIDFDYVAYFDEVDGMAATDIEFMDGTKIRATHPLNEIHGLCPKAVLVHRWSASGPTRDTKSPVYVNPHAVKQINSCPDPKDGSRIILRGETKREFYVSETLAENLSKLWPDDNKG